MNFNFSLLGVVGLKALSPIVFYSSSPITPITQFELGGFFLSVLIPSSSSLFSFLGVNVCRPRSESLKFYDKK